MNVQPVVAGVPQGNTAAVVYSVVHSRPRLDSIGCAPALQVRTPQSVEMLTAPTQSSRAACADGGAVRTMAISNSIGTLASWASIIGISGGTGGDLAST